MRNTIGYSPSGRKARYGVHLNAKGQPLLLLEEGEAARLVLDFTDYLDGGETVSSASVSNNGISVSASVSSPKVTLTASNAGSFGTTEVTVILSTGDKIVETIEIRNRNAGAQPSDYCAA